MSETLSNYPPYESIFDAFLYMTSNPKDIQSMDAGEFQKGMGRALRRLEASAIGLIMRFPRTSGVASTLRNLLDQSIPYSKISTHTLQSEISKDTEFAPKLPIAHTNDGIIVYGLATVRTENAGVYHATWTPEAGRLYFDLASEYKRLFDHCANGRVSGEPNAVKDLILRIEEMWGAEAKTPVRRGHNA